jgi:hypothetical protein
MRFRVFWLAGILLHANVALSAGRTHAPVKKPSIRLRFGLVGFHHVEYDAASRTFSTKDTHAIEIEGHTVATMKAIRSGLVIKLDLLRALPRLRTDVRIIVEPIDDHRSLSVCAQEIYALGFHLRDAVKHSLVVDDLLRPHLLDRLPDGDGGGTEWSYSPMGEPLIQDWREGNVIVTSEPDLSGDHRPIVEHRVRHGGRLDIGTPFVDPWVGIYNDAPVPVSRPPDARRRVDWSAVPSLND